MPDLVFERHVPHLPERMYDLVSDLEDYPRFIPNCTEMIVKPDYGAVGDVRFAKMTIRFGPVTQAYTSKVTLDPEARTIAAKAVDGPFSHLDSLWRFEPEGMGTRVRFAIDFKISNRLIAAVAEPAFAAKQNEIMQAFADEADRRYGGKTY
jgi:coenzyme Q-binding protein COQ10